MPPTPQRISQHPRNDKELEGDKDLSGVDVYFTESGDVTTT